MQNCNHGMLFMIVHPYIILRMSLSNLTDYKDYIYLFYLGTGDTRQLCDTHLVSVLFVWHLY